MDNQAALARLDEAAQQGKITSAKYGDDPKTTALENIVKWLTEPQYAEYAPQIIEHVAAENWRALDDAFWTVIPFGTGGRRGRMYPIGCNAINDRTIGESAQGLANYVRQECGDASLSCAIAYDTRHKSRHFAELCAGIMAAAGFHVYFLDDHRSTPELSFAVRYKQATCGIMVTASHNPPSDNAVKVYWSTGGQILPPHDKNIIAEVMSVEQIEKLDFQQALADGKVEICTADCDARFIEAVAGQSLGPSRDLKIVFSPLHGVGATAAVPALEAVGFKQVEVFGPHAEPDPDFTNVPGHSSNPENTAVFDIIIEHCQQTGADIAIATDPDCDRIGVAAPVTTDPAGPWRTYTGNQIGVLLTDYVLARRKAAGTLSPEHYIVKTLVTTEMARRIADSYQVRTVGDLLVGFKWIAGAMDEQGPGKFVFGTEESHGYLVGQYARDKDGAVATMLFAELAAELKAAGVSVAEQLDKLYWQHGYHIERLVNKAMAGSDGMRRTAALMEAFRTKPPQSLGGLAVSAVRDYAAQTRTTPGGSPEALTGPQGNMVMLDLAEEGNYIAVRPSGTEPKVKFYMFTYVPAEQLADLERTKQEMSARLDAWAADLDAYVETV